MGWICRDHRHYILYLLQYYLKGATQASTLPGSKLHRFIYIYIGFTPLFSLHFCSPPSILPILRWFKPYFLSAKLLLLLHLIIFFPFFHHFLPFFLCFFPYFPQFLLTLIAPGQSPSSMLLLHPGIKGQILGFYTYKYLEIRDPLFVIYCKYKNPNNSKVSIMLIWIRNWWWTVDPCQIKTLGDTEPFISIDVMLILIQHFW